MSDEWEAAATAEGGLTTRRGDAEDGARGDGVVAGVSDLRGGKGRGVLNIDGQDGQDWRGVGAGWSESCGRI